MAEFTKNLNMEKPAGNDNFRREVINKNMDMIDNKFGIEEGEGHVHDGTKGQGKKISFNSLADKPAKMPPTAHKTEHAVGGTDALTPADIGAASQAELDAHKIDYAQLKAQVENPTYSAETTTTAPVFSVPPTTVKAPFSEFRLKGNTLKNELNYNRDTWVEWAKYGATGDSIGLTLSSPANGSASACIANDIKISTKYGFLYSVVQSNLVSDVFLIGGGGDGTGNFYDTPSPKTVGNQVAILTSRSVKGSVTYVQASGPAAETIKIRDIRCFELPTGSQIESDFNNLTADQLAVKYPYVQGGTLQGTGSQKVTVTGKNLFDYKLDKLTVASIYQLKNMVSGTLYTLSKNGVAQYDLLGFKNGVHVVNLVQDTPNTAAFESSNSTYDSVFIRFDSIPDINEKIQLEKGESATTYEPYTETTVITPDIGYSLANGICDEIDILTGKKVQRVGKVVLNGSENWSDAGLNLSNSMCFVVELANEKTDSILFSDKFKYFGNLWSNREIADKDEEGISGHNVYNYLHVRILKSKLYTQDVAGFKAWLVANPTTVIYQLATPIVTYYPSKQLVAEPGGQIIIESGWKEKVLQASDITVCNSGTNTQLINIKKMTDEITYGKTSSSAVDCTWAILEGFTPGNHDNLDHAGYVYKMSGYPVGSYTISVPLNTYANLSAAQVSLTGKILTYKIANSGTLPATTESHAIDIKAQTDSNTNAIGRLDEKANIINYRVDAHKTEKASQTTLSHIKLGTGLSSVTDGTTTACRQKQVTTTHDASVTGSQTISGVGFTPRRVDVIAAINGTNACSVGTYITGDNNYCLANKQAASANWSASEAIIYINTAAGNVSYAGCSSNSDGCTLNWVKSGSPTGTITLILNFIE